ncbi:TonB-dependent receptor [Luteolibacter flavescens]|uniref:TonB-dependent receptor n=1 Tax=Luteolibacter flavescens TaxID=1859460 RepID=A0ABT3FQ39_9BACT|nr:TonB-dependent receptor [Luteolibacter flavescens]MCW1885562.1 TonB-dependent receptor [Luteolibacter flavescens]
MHAFPAIASAILMTMPSSSGQSPAEESAPASATEADVFGDLPADEGGMEMLGEMVVESSKLDETFAETQTSIGRVNAERIDNSQIRDVNSAYRLLGNVRAPQFVDGGFVIRGMNSEAPDAENISGDQAALSTIYVDGVALTQQSARRGPTRAWDVATIDVLRGPQSTLRGKNSLAGAVIIETKDPEPGYGGAYRATYGSHGLREHAAMLNLAVTDEFALRFTFEDSERESFVTYPLLVSQPRYEDFRTSDFLQFRAKALYQPTASPFSSKLTYAYSESSPALSDVFGPNADPRVPSFFDRLWLTGSGTQQIRDTTGHLLSWENRLELTDQLRLTALTTWVDTDLEVGQVDGGKVRDDNELEFTQEIRANWDDTWGKAVLGAYYSENEGTSTQSDIDRQRRHAAVFGEIDWLLGERWHLIGGGRLFHEDYRFSSNSGTTKSSETDFLPKLGVRYDFNPEHTLGFTFQRGYQSGGSGIDLQSPYQFDPSSTNHYEIAYRRALFGGRASLSANAFYSDWKDQQVVIRTLDPATFQGSERVINAANSTLYGAEIELRAQATESVELFGSLGLLDSQYDDFVYRVDPALTASGIPATMNFAGYEFPEAAPVTASLGFTWKPWKGMYLSGDVSYSAAYYSPVLFAPLGGSTGFLPIQVPQDDTVEIDSFITVNLQAGYRSEHWEVSLFVENLFDENHVVGKVPFTSLGPDGPAFQDNFLATVGAPRTYGASFTVRF